ncbi:glutathione peroxidase [Kipferlia bialata]|uniref:Glutathione peroxidase n=1 Tax=Kipferlia bialata TaxID=797122 RepID=A0A9K3CP73_9EUKA|nr:glutathione peroxidase [Kipferlia bialata]|eukprot:g424.t1
MEPTSIYDFTVKNSRGEDVDLSQYRGQPVLVLNTASKCGFTPQLEGLQLLHETYPSLVILGFPCNQFGNQEPLEGEEVGACYFASFKVDFPILDKIDVNGDNAAPIYKYLKKAKGGVFGNAIKWNFTKFLCNKEGVPVKRYAPTTKPAKMAKDIEAVL